MNIKEAIHLYLSYKESLGEKIRDVRYLLLRFTAGHLVPADFQLFII